MKDIPIELIHWREAWAEADAQGNSLPFISSLLASVIEEARERIARHRPQTPQTPAEMVAEDVLKRADAELQSLESIITYR